jgi:hypothetical protein
MDFWNRIRHVATALAVIAWLLAIAAGWLPGNGRGAAPPACIANCL